MQTNAFMSLVRLQWRQFFRGDKKNSTVGLIFFVVYAWLIELVLFFIFKDEGVEVPTLAMVLVSCGVLVPDFILKLFFQRDNSVMDASLKTRPIPKKVWKKFLGLSQFWSPLNLEMPLMMIPACFFFLPVGIAFAEIPVLYLLSVLGGYLVMLIKHRGDYQPERLVSSRGRVAKSAPGSHIFGLQSRCVMRSKRLKTSIIYMTVLFYLQFVLYSFEDDMDLFAGCFQFFVIFLGCVSVLQYGFGIEANYFGAIWTKPVSIYRILEDKYRMSAVFGSIAAVLCLPVCILSHSSVLDPFAYLLFSAGFCSLTMLLEAPKCSRLDIFGKTFFNYQGTTGSFKASSLLPCLLTLTFGMGLPRLLPGWPSRLILCVLGLGGFAVHRRVLRRVESNFLKNRYKYMDKYNSI